MSATIKAELHNTTHDHGLIHGFVTLPDGSHHPIEPAALPDAREQVLQLATNYVRENIALETALEVTDPDGWWLIGLQLDGTRIPLDSKPANTTPPPHNHVTANGSANGRQPLPATHSVTPPAQPDQSPNGREPTRATDAPANERDTTPPDAFSLTEPRDRLDLFAELAPAALSAAPTRPSPRPRRSTTMRRGSSRRALAAVALVLAAALTATLVLRATAGNDPARAARVPRASAPAHRHVVLNASSTSRSAVPGKPQALRVSFPPPALRRPAHDAPSPARHRAQRPHRRGAERHHTSRPPITAPPAAPAAPAAAAAAPARAETTTPTATPAAATAPAASYTTTRAAPQYTPPPAPAPCYPGELGC
jgi:hypothetical protein